MKKIITALLALLSIVSCTKESTESYPSSGEVKFTTQSDLTRASEKTSWIGGEQIGIYSAEYINVPYEATLTGSDSETVTFSAVSSAVYYSSHTSESTFYAYYPYDGDVADNEVSFDLADQEDMLWSSATAKEGNDVEFTFGHVHSIIELAVSKGADLDDLDDLTISISSYTKGSMDILDADVTPTEYNNDGMSMSVVLNTETNSESATTSVIVMAHDYTDEEEDEDVTINFSVGNRTFTQTLSPKWESGYKYKYSAKVGFDTITFTAGDITAWGTEVSDDALASGYDIVISADDSGSDLFQIYTAKGLAAFRDLVNGADDNDDARIDNKTENTYTFDTAYKTISGKLMNDINLEDICYDTESSWTPIGGVNYMYTGTFDGGGFEVQGLYINTKYSYQGLFGYISSATIQNLGVRGSVTNTDESNTGGLVGYNSGGTINLCYSAVTVNGVTNTGGVVGCNTGGKIINSYNIGSVSSTGNNVGGVVGSAISSPTIANCYNMGSVSGTNDYVGGVVGKNGGTTTNCYSVGSVSGSSSVGGVVGHNYGTTTNCYYNTNYYGGVGVGEDSGTSEIIACTSQYMKSEDFVTQLDNGAYAYDSNDTIGLKAWTQVSDGYPVIDSLTSPTATELDYSVINGTYYIYNATGLEAFRSYVNDGNTATNAVLMADIDLFSSTLTPIGTSTCGYAGTFDGNGFEVQNLAIKPSESSQALFAYTDSGCKIKNLGVTSDISASGASASGSHLAGLVANNYGAITNCYSSFKLTLTGAHSYIGGLVAYNYSSGTITNCYNTESISAPNASYVGGLVANNEGGTITNCYNTATVSGNIFVGGLIGQNHSSGVVANCYNSGNVTIYATSSLVLYNVAGGIVGYNNPNSTITACYNSGTMVTDATSGYSSIVGSVAGYNDGTISYCYYPNSGVAVGGGSSSTSNCSTVTDMTTAEFLATMNAAAYTYYETTSPTISPCSWVTGTGSTPTLDFESLATSN